MEGWADQEAYERHESADTFLTALATVVNNVRILDRQGGMLDTDETERLALNKQVNRHEDWITRAAPKVSVRYTG